MLNNILKNMNLFVDGVGHAGNIDEIILPVLTTITEEFRGGGMDAAVMVDMGMEALETSFALTSIPPATLKLYGLQKDFRKNIQVRGAVEDELDGSVKAVVIDLTGRFVMVDYGTWKPGDKATVTMKMSVDYYKLTMDGEILHEIDILNFRRVINGVDQLADRRSAMGV